MAIIIIITIMLLLRLALLLLMLLRYRKVPMHLHYMLVEATVMAGSDFAFLGKEGCWHRCEV